MNEWKEAAALAAGTEDPKLACVLLTFAAWRTFPREERAGYLGELLAFLARTAQQAGFTLPDGFIPGNGSEEGEGEPWGNVHGSSSGAAP